VLLEAEVFIRLHAFYKCLCFKPNLNKSANNASLTPPTIGKHLLPVIVNGMRLDIIKNAHPFLSQPDVFIRINRFNAALATCRDKRQILSSRGPDNGWLFSPLNISSERALGGAAAINLK